MHICKFHWTRKLLTINTHKGLFTYTRLPFGVSSSPAIFQRTIEAVLQGVPNVAVYLDDILLTGCNDQQHIGMVGAVLSHKMRDGTERPMGFMSRTLTPAENDYFQLDKDGLAIIEVKAVPHIVSPGVPRWAVTLRVYEYVIVYKAGKDRSNMSTHHHSARGQSAVTGDSGTGKGTDK
ncbi:hypothetical protein N1851_027216 [Merluccius polli]|uniref:ribonuclease H n=1 Tax=Merluccius polli TaxID=89951 RepID=A0AA47MAF8_MERPO|nr:hypothetical protein N1851_027216 [Merluccius polli]